MSTLAEGRSFKAGDKVLLTRGVADKEVCRQEVLQTSGVADKRCCRQGELLYLDPWQSQIPPSFSSSCRIKSLPPYFVVV